MDPSGPFVHVFDHREDAQSAVQALGRAGPGMRRLSMVGKGARPGDPPVGFYPAGHHLQVWDGSGAFWGGLWSSMADPAVFVLPGLGVVVLAGPVAAGLVTALEGAWVVTGASAMAAAFMQVGVPREQAERHVLALKQDKYMLLVHGVGKEIVQARRIIAHVTGRLATATG